MQYLRVLYILILKQFCHGEESLSCFTLRDCFPLQQQVQDLGECHDALFGFDGHRIELA